MRSLIVLLFLFLVYNSESQTRFVEGIVIESHSKEPLIGATVYQPETKAICNTDFYGKFTLELIGTEKAHIYISYTGYECKIQEIDVNVEYVEISLEVEQGIPPMRIIEYKMPNKAKETPIDSIRQLCNRYQNEIDSIFSIMNKKGK